MDIEKKRMVSFLLQLMLLVMLSYSEILTQNWESLNTGETNDNTSRYFVNEASRFRNYNPSIAIDSAGNESGYINDVGATPFIFSYGSTAITYVGRVYNTVQIG
ncbi:MAG: hypothetical protein KKD86_06550, partial [Bacteroidetes bacterium]|nr:hypothetical protein [Bacteroidota bacterium]